ncbi:MAG TPA: PrsW family glutamic-type intramembrane protease [Anaerolineales bacterium]|nr:PrsW family glutamic-type intramembrane protease [Anaerolineales bacterium]
MHPAHGGGVILISNMQSPAQPVKPPLHWPSLIQLILSALAAFILLGAAVVIIISAAFKYFANSVVIAELVQPFMVAASLAFAGVLVLPSAWYAWRHIAFQEREPTLYRERRGTVLILTIVVIALVGGALWLGNWVAQNDQLAWLLLPPLNIIANGLPAFWMVYVGTRGLIPGAPKRLWGVFASGLVLGPFIILILELLLLVFVGVFAIIWVMLNPDLANQLYSLATRIQSVGPNLDVILRQIGPFLANPGIIFLMFAYISVLVPMIEEVLKPIGVWFLYGQKLTPAQGFGYGVLSGAGFGLFENLGNTSGGAAGWALLASTRISTIMLHSFTAGLVGWALASAWSERRYWRLLIAYICAVIVHGLWNGLALVTAVNSLQGFADITLPTYIQQIGTYSSFGIILLGVIVLFLYLGSNAFLRRKLSAINLASSQVDRPPIAPETLTPPPELGTFLQSNPETNSPQTAFREDNPNQVDEDDNPGANPDKPTDTKGINE